jgi:ABC-type uncharacterized transport system, ATPase component
MESVEELCDHIALINEAEKILDGPKKEIKNQFRNNTFNIEHFTPISGLPAGFEIKSTRNIGDEIIESQIHIKDNSKANDLLQLIIQQTEIRSFSEIIPSINDIFIRSVKEQAHG